MLTVCTKDGGQIGEMAICTATSRQKELRARLQLSCRSRSKTR